MLRSVMESRGIRPGSGNESIDDECFSVDDNEGDDGKRVSSAQMTTRTMRRNGRIRRR